MATIKRQKLQVEEAETHRRPAMARYFWTWEKDSSFSTATLKMDTHSKAVNQPHLAAHLSIVASVGIIVVILLAALPLPDTRMV